MSWKPSFRAKATAGFGAVLVATVVVGSVASLGARSSARDATQVARYQADGLMLTQRVRFRLERAVADGRGYLLFGDVSVLARARESWVQVEATLQALDERLTSPVGRAQLRRIAEAAGGYQAVMNRVIAERREKPDLDALQHFERQLQVERDEIDAAVEQLWAEQVRSLEQGLGGIRASAARASTFIVLTGAVGLLVSLLLARIVIGELARLYEREEHAARTARAALGARDDLLAIIAHDLRSPLNAILMNAELIRKRAAPAESGSDARKHAEAIESIAQRMEYLIRSLLDAATIEAGHLSVAPASCDAGDLLQATFEMLAPVARAKSIHLDLHAPDGPLVVWADRERVLQVLSNLVTNAIKFTRENGTIGMRVELAACEARFAVADTGIGMGEADRTHAFERYWKAEKGGRRGAGLGLYIAKGIVEASGGSLWVESRLGEGSTFFFTLPTVDAGTEGPLRPTVHHEGADVGVAHHG